jgi:RimJ/RimL family protein N-acetyltransferase
MILQTKRLILREFNLSDTGFIIALLNSPTWLEFIVDKKIKSKKDAENYIQNSLIKSYKENGFGLWLVQLAKENKPVGMCGLVNRDTLEDIDIGFAMLPQYAGKGFGYEAAQATLNHAKDILKIKKVVAITSKKNVASIKLLEKLGLTFTKEMELEKDNKVILFAPSKKFQYS